jgi:hypothetical protein
MKLEHLETLEWKVSCKSIGEAAEHMIKLIIDKFQPNFNDIKNIGIDKIFLIGGIFEDSFFATRFTEILKEEINS